MKAWKKAWALLEDISAGTFFSAGIALIFYGVLMRYVFNSPKAWVEEVSSYLVIWGALLGISVALRNDHHIQIDMLYDKLPASAKRWVDLFANFVGILFSVFYAYYGYLLVAKRYTSGMVSMDVGIPMWIVYLILPISGILFLLRFIERFVHHVKGKGDVHADRSAF
ncbi:TRAP transporter small permease [Ferviditalea candida]|uniref:TRAP transporter small permease n=1 Tax=Ferviditalea candida TaxID=3108399 RepID=A0ABU5ZET7_9BACL|nr:TRAP transporter small permease [Paenibacillaceae bacterium T2]